MTDLTDYTDEDLEQLRVKVVAEQNRRWTISSVPDQMDKLVRDLLAASGQVVGGVWVQPTSAMDAYPEGWTVEHDGKQWVSLTPANVWIPGQSGWREVVAEGSTPDWVQPAGSHDAYQTGDHITFEGAEYVSLIDGNIWSPTAYPQGWELVIPS